MTAVSADRRAALGLLLGGYAPSPLRLIRQTPLETAQPGYRAFAVALSSGNDPEIRGFLTGPDEAWQGEIAQHLPAVLYCHAHGNRHDIGARELLDGRPALLPEAYGKALARHGIVALCIDMPCFGSRAGETESSRAKRLHWRGDTLFGEMLRDLGGALGVLATLPGVDPARLGVFGFSMGATHAFWLGALEPRLAVIAHACCFADLELLIAGGGHDLHGPYMTVPGLVSAFSTGEIAGLCAPRRQLVLVGADDPLTPPDAVAKGLADLGAAYDRAGAQRALTTQVFPGVGHRETPDMRAEVLAFLGAL